MDPESFLSVSLPHPSSQFHLILSPFPTIICSKKSLLSVIYTLAQVSVPKLHGTSKPWDSGSELRSFSKQKPCLLLSSCQALEWRWGRAFLVTLKSHQGSHLLTHAERACPDSESSCILLKRHGCCNHPLLLACYILQAHLVTVSIRHSPICT